MDASQETDTLSSISTMSSLNHEEGVPPFGFYGQYREKYGEVLPYSTGSSSNEDTPQRRSSARDRRRKKHHHDHHVRARPASASPPRRRAVTPPAKERASDAQRSSSSLPKRSDVEERYWAHRRQATENITNVNQRITAARQRLISQMKRLDGCSENLKSDNSQLQRLKYAQESQPKEKNERKHIHMDWRDPGWRNFNAAFSNETTHHHPRWQPPANDQDDDSRYAALQEKISKDMKKGKRLLANAKKRNPKTKRSTDKDRKPKRRHSPNARDNSATCSSTARKVEETRPAAPAKYSGGVVPNTSQTEMTDISGLFQESQVLSITIPSDDTVTPKLKKMKDTIKRKTEQVSWLQKELESRDKEISNVRNRNETLEQDYASAKDNYYKLQEQLSEAKANSSLLESKLQWVQEQNSTLKGELETSRQSREEIERLAEQSVRRKYEREQEQWEKRVEEVRNQLTKYYEEQLELLRNELEAKRNVSIAEPEKNQEQSRNRQFLEERVQELSDKVTRLQTEKDSECRRANQEHERMTSLYTDIQEKGEEVQKLKTEINALHEQIERKRASMQSVQHQLLVTQQELDDAKSENWRLQEMNKERIRKKEVDGMLVGVCYKLRHLQKDFEQFFEHSLWRLSSLDDRHTKNTDKVIKCRRRLQEWRHRVHRKHSEKLEEGKLMHQRKLDEAMEEKQHKQNLFEDEIESYKKSLSELRSSHAAVQREKEACKREIDSLQYELNSKRDQLEHYKEENGELRKNLQQQEVDFERESSKLQEKSHKISVLEEQLQNETEKADRLQAELRTAQTNLVEEKHSREELENNLEKKRTESEELQRQFNSCQRTSEQARETSRRSQEELAEALRSHQEEVASLMNLINTQRKELTHLRSSVSSPGRDHFSQQYRTTQSTTATFLTSEEETPCEQSADAGAVHHVAPSTQTVSTEEEHSMLPKGTSETKPNTARWESLGENVGSVVPGSSVSQQSQDTSFEGSSSTSQLLTTAAAGAVPSVSALTRESTVEPVYPTREGSPGKRVTYSEANAVTSTSGNQKGEPTYGKQQDAITNAAHTGDDLTELHNEPDTETTTIATAVGESCANASATPTLKQDAVSESKEEGSDWDEESNWDESEDAVATSHPQSVAHHATDMSFRSSERSDWDGQEQVARNDDDFYNSTAETSPDDECVDENEKTDEQVRPSSAAKTTQSNEASMGSTTDHAPVSIYCKKNKKNHFFK
eukprot:gb/GECG01015517.1/.p1 GENE.gb/GECG01015517.1/~~gb/GECG01015517.1/.p1  ORF type:complete len:1224 (+),score=238.61 gb/GECG01015517.1/:1-3672(+)